jgi:hypothetical protein
MPPGIIDARKKAWRFKDGSRTQEKHEPSMKNVFRTGPFSVQLRAGHAGFHKFASEIEAQAKLKSGYSHFLGPLSTIIPLPERGFAQRRQGREE